MPRVDALRVLLLALLSVTLVAVEAVGVQHSKELAKTNHELELKSDETIVRCRSCGAPVAYKKCALSLTPFLRLCLAIDPFLLLL